MKASDHDATLSDMGYFEFTSNLDVIHCSVVSCIRVTELAVFPRFLKRCKFKASCV